MPDPVLSCRIFAVGTRGDVGLPQALAGLNAQWVTSPHLNGVVHDLYVLDSAVGTREILKLYGRIRDAERNVPVVLVGTNRNMPILQEKVSGDPGAYLAMRGGSTNLRALIDKVISATHTQALAARIEETRTIVDALTEGQARLEERHRQWQRRLTSRRWLVLRAQTMRCFQQSGGTVAQFRELWPAVCHEALASFDRPSAPG